MRERESERGILGNWTGGKGGKNLPPPKCFVKYSWFRGSEIDREVVRGKSEVFGEESEVVG